MIVVIVANLQAKEVRAEEFGVNTILYNLVGGEDLEKVTAEITMVSSESNLKSYSEVQRASLKSPLAKQPLTQEEIEQEVETATGLAQGTGVLKPDMTVTKREKIIEYTVEGGDVVSTIAEKFDINTQTLLEENNLSYYSIIKPGQVLMILPTDGVSHIVKNGDTIQSIAKLYSAETDQIIKYNKIPNETIFIDQQLIVPGGSKPRPATPITTSSRLASVSKIFSPVTSSPSAGMLWPTSARRISQYYHWRHTGLDIDGDTGDHIWASESGTVTLSTCTRWGYGCYVIVNHGGGKETLYAHFIKLFVKKGQRVDKGQVLGEMGSTGRSTGSHLHYEVRINGARLNPLQYIR